MAAMESLTNTRILVVGDCMHDVYEYFSTGHRKELKSEFPGKWAYFNAQETDALGGAGNVAANIAGVGALTRLVGVVGADDSGARLQTLCKAAGVEPALIVAPDRETTLKMRFYIDGEFLLRRDRETAAAISPALVDAVQSSVFENLESFSALVLSDYDKGVFDQRTGLSASILARAAQAGVPVVVDCKPKNFSQFKGATMVAPNELEAVALIPDFGRDRAKGVRKLREQIGVEYCVVTLGEEGLICASANDVITIPGERVTVKNPVGAGDTVRAFMAIGLSAGLDIEQTLRLANRAAALVIQKEATATVSVAEFQSIAAEIMTPSFE
jgi:rfaE bifunctional protein kinase chain/domain